MDGSLNQGMGAVGINHRYVFPKNAYLNTSFAFSGSINPNIPASGPCKYPTCCSQRRITETTTTTNPGR